jgi:hypothetical protein
VPTPEAQMLGTTAFALGMRTGATADDLLADWERFALPLLEADAPGGGDLAPSGTLLAIRGDVHLSSVRRRDSRIEARVWNRRRDRDAVASIDGREVRLGPARIETVALER